MTQYLNEKLAGNINSEDSSKSTPKKKKGHSELLEKSPVTPPIYIYIFLMFFIRIIKN
jgi:hypothetical protein